MNGINHFSASIILCQVSLEEFIDLLPEERVSAFGAYILPDRIVCHSLFFHRVVGYSHLDIRGSVTRILTLV